MDASLLAHWQNFYVILGSSAGALTGLQFVVITLVAQSRLAGSMVEIRAFGSPNVVHFCFALLISAVGTAPWRSLTAASVTLTICGVAGLIYAVSVIRHAKNVTGYQPDREDWFWYIVLPLVTYAILIVSAVLLASHPAVAQYVVAGSALLLLFNGIHNAWDTVTFVAMHHRHDRQRSDATESRPADSSGDTAA
jgi:hypothetical protein